MALSPYMQERIATRLFEPANSEAPTSSVPLLVLAPGIGESVTNQPDDGLSTRIRTRTEQLARRISDTIGLPVLAYTRPGLEAGIGKQSLRKLLEIRHELNPESDTPAVSRYLTSMYDVGAVIRDRINRRHRKFGAIILAGHSGGAMAAAALGHSNSVGAEGTILLDPVGIHAFTRRPLSGRTAPAFIGWLGYQKYARAHATRPDTPPVAGTIATPIRSILRDMFLYGEAAGSDVTKKCIVGISIPTAVDLAEYGINSQIMGQDTTEELVTSFNKLPHVTASIRPGITHGWYDTPASNYNIAITDNLRQLQGLGVNLGSWPLNDA